MASVDRSHLFNKSQPQASAEDLKETPEATDTQLAQAVNIRTFFGRPRIGTERRVPISISLAPFTIKLIEGEARKREIKLSTLMDEIIEEHFK